MYAPTSAGSTPAVATAIGFGRRRRGSRTAPSARVVADASRISTARAPAPRSRWVVSSACHATVRASPSYAARTAGPPVAGRPAAAATARAAPASRSASAHRPELGAREERRAGRREVERGERGPAGALRLRPGPELQGRVHDDAERPVGADVELHEIVPGHVLHDLPAGAHELAVGRHHADADHEVARGAVPLSPGPRAVGGERAAERRLAGRRGIERHPLAARPQRALERVEGDPGLRRRGEIARLVLDDAVRCAEGRRRALRPAAECPATSGSRRPTAPPAPRRPRRPAPRAPPHRPNPAGRHRRASAHPRRRGPDRRRRGSAARPTISARVWSRAGGHAGGAPRAPQRRWISPLASSGCGW